MNRESTLRETWHPQTTEERGAVLEELKAIAASPHFCNSKRYPALLHYIVENALAGRADLLKERTLGVEVFDRPPTYDTNADTVVRYTAGEVRKRLLLYYSEHSPQGEIRISLPAGSYIPEFLYEHHGTEAAGEETAPPASRNGDQELVSETNEFRPARPSTDHTWQAPGEAEGHSPLPPRTFKLTTTRLIWLVVVLIALGGMLVGLRWKYSPARTRTAVDDFWEPVLQRQRPVLLCTGSVVFAQGNFSGVVTAGKDIDYPFVSMQIVSAVSQLSGLLERSGATTQLVSSASIPLTDLRDHSVILLGGYNNKWTMRLMEQQRFQFTQEPVESIVDRTQPQVHWSRDRSIPYSSADDYALVARFRDTTTGSWVVVLAGLGRNGTEAAANFATSPDYLQLMKDKVGKKFSTGNIEAVLKIRVVDGKTGAPSILATSSW